MPTALYTFADGETRPLPTPPYVDDAKVSLTDNARTIFMKRYARKTLDGSLQETPAGVFYRVAYHVAQGEPDETKREKMTEPFYHLLASRRFFPNSPTFTGAGTRLNQLAACFPAGTMISTMDGPRPIEQIGVGDYVLTDKGRYRPVTETMARRDQLYRIEIDKLPDLYVTGEHPFLTAEGWVKAKDLIPKQTFVKVGFTTETTELAPMIHFEGVEVEGMVYQANVDVRQRSGPVSHHVTPVRTGIVVDADLAWLFGLFIAQGSVSGTDIRFTLGLHRQAQAEKVQQLLLHYFGLEATSIPTHHEERNADWLTVRLHSKILAGWLVDNFGKGAKGKFLPHWLMTAPVYVQEAFLQGVADGDGTPVNRDQTRIVLVNESLVRQLFEMALRLGFYPNLRAASLGKLSTGQPWAVSYGQTYQKHMVKDGCYRVTGVALTDREEPVFNFEVEEDHTYVANQVVVHNCFVLGLEDDMGKDKQGIFSTLRVAALIQQTGGGNGFSFGKLRPKRDQVTSTGGAATGPVGFLKMYDACFGEVEQGGLRRGANMAVLPVHHPDIREFIACKTEEGKIANFNISVGVTDAFMEAVTKGESFALLNPRNGEVWDTVDARSLFDQIVKQAHHNGEPGLLFLDAANRANPVPHLYTLEATNPCVTGDTLVLTPDGERPVAAIQVGETICTVDGRGTVDRIEIYYDRPVFTVTFENEAVIRCTAAHQFWVPTKSRTGYLPVKLEALRAGDEVRSAGDRMPGSQSHLPTTRIADIAFAGWETVYDLHEPKTDTWITNGIVSRGCGEQWLGPYENCCLGSINLAEHWKVVAGLPVVDWEKLADSTRMATFFLDDVVTINAYVPVVPELREAAEASRRIGLGIMGLADLLYALHLPYDSEGGRALAGQVMEFVRYYALSTSVDLALERGSFKGYAGSVYDFNQPGGMPWQPPHATQPTDYAFGRPTLYWDSLRRNVEDFGVRNACQTTIAPTGTLSSVAGCEGYGCEPVFALGYIRHFKDGQKDVELPYVSTAFQNALGHLNLGLDTERAILDHVARTGTCQDLTILPEAFRRTFVVSGDIAPRDHVLMQAALQQFVDNSISKCLAEGTLIQTDQGLVAVEDFSTNEQAGTFAPVTGLRTSLGEQITSHYCAGKLPATRVRLNNGAALVGATATHRVMTVDGWKRLADLQPRDWVVGKFAESHGPGGKPISWVDDFYNNSNVYPTPKAMTPSFALFLGMLCADGHLQEDTGTVSLTKNNPAVLAQFVALSRELFNAEAEIKTDIRNGVTTAFFTSRNAVRYLRALIGYRAHDKHVPAQLLQGSKAEKLAFLSGLSLDGYLRPKVGLVVYDGRSEALAYQTFELCQSFGLPKVYLGRRRVAEHGGYVYGVTVSNEMQALVIPLEEHKRGDIASCRYMVQIDPEQIEAVRVTTGNAAYYNWRTLHQRRPRVCWNTTAASLQLPALAPVYRVEEVEEAGEVMMYDISVEGSHSYVTNGIINHNTINLPATATPEDVKEVYQLAWELGCKGITVYVTGSRDKVVLETQVTKTQKADFLAEILHTMTNAGTVTEAAYLERMRPPHLAGSTYRKATPLGKAYITVNDDDQGEPFEVFINVGKAGSETAAVSEGIGRLISLFLRAPSPLAPKDRLGQVVEQLIGIGGNRPWGYGNGRVLSLPDGIAQVLNQHLNGDNGHAETKAPTPDVPVKTFTLVVGDLCPDCGDATFVQTEGCRKCLACGYSEC